MIDSTYEGAHAAIDLLAISANLSRVRTMAPDSKVMAIIKANAYGHGAAEVANALADADGFGVARLSEARALRDAGVSGSITLLEGIMNRSQIMSASEVNADVVVHSMYQVDLLRTSGFAGGIWVKVTTGMNRLGFTLEILPQVLHELMACKVLGIMTHLSHADSNPDVTNHQIELFHQGTAQFDLPLSIANSAGIIDYPAARVGWVRPGLMLFGASPFPERSVTGLHTVMTMSAPIIAINQIRKGDSIGYGGQWTAPMDSRIAVLAIGYADGYPRELQNGSCLLTNGKRRQLVGLVTMDMTCVLLEEGDNTQVGDHAILWGKGLPIEEVAQSAGTIAYTLMCRTGNRVIHEYVN